MRTMRPGLWRQCRSPWAVRRLVRDLITAASPRNAAGPSRSSPPRALDFFDQAVIEKAAGSPVRSQYSKPGAPRSQIPDAVIFALASYNTINNWALGISDTYALGVLAETIGLDVPMAVLPFVNSTLVGREPFRRSAEGVRILPGPGGFQPRKSQSPHLSGAGGVRPRPSAPVASLGLVEDPGRAADRLSGVTAAVDRLAGGAFERSGFLTAVIPDKAGG